MVSSLIFEDDVFDTSAISVNVELLLTTIEGIDDDDNWFVEQLSSSVGGAGVSGAVNDWVSIETDDDCVSKDKNNSHNNLLSSQLMLLGRWNIFVFFSIE